MKAPQICGAFIIRGAFFGEDLRLNNGRSIVNDGDASLRLGVDGGDGAAEDGFHVVGEGVADEVGAVEDLFAVLEYPEDSTGVL